MAKKMTKREKFEMLANIPAVAENDMLMEFISHELDLLAKKNTSSTGEKKLTATQMANEGLKSEILDMMDMDTLYSIDQMIKTFPCCAELSTSKVSAMLTQLIKAEKVERVADKRKAYFRKVVA